MRDQKSVSIRRILYGLALLVAGGFLQCGCADLLALGTQMKSYMNEKADPCNNF